LHIKILIKCWDVYKLTFSAESAGQEFVSGCRAHAVAVGVDDHASVECAHASAQLVDSVSLFDWTEDALPVRVHAPAPLHWAHAVAVSVHEALLCRARGCYIIEKNWYKSMMGKLVKVAICIPLIIDTQKCSNFLNQHASAFMQSWISQKNLIWKERIDQ
jgi:hypothetical protein